MKKLNKYLFLFVVLFKIQTIFAQQDPMYSMYMFDKMLINPAFTGSSNWMIGTLKHREQFVGMTGHPSTETFNFHTPIQKKHIGVGFKISNDKNGIISNLNATGLFSYHLNFAGGKLSVGVEAGVFNRKVNYQKLILSSQNDNVIPTTSVSSLVPDAGYGFYFQKKQFYAGFSQNHIIKKTFNYNETVKAQSHLYNHLYFIAGNVFDISKKWTVEPSILVKYQSASPLQIDLNTTVYYVDRIGLGLQYRTGDALVAILRVNITENLRIAYSYDITLSKLAPYSKGSHEIIISYGIKLPPPPSQKEIHPRYYF